MKIKLTFLLMISVFTSCHTENKNILKHTITEKTESFKKGTKIRYTGEIVLLDKNSPTTPEILKELLSHKYDSIMRLKTKPNFIDIKIYKTTEHLNSGMGQWIGWMEKNNSNTEPAFYFQNNKDIEYEVFNQIPTSDNQVVSNKLSKAEKLKIWNETIKLQDKARSESEKKYPVIDTREKSALKYDLEDELWSKYESDLLLKHNITKEDLKKISNEGLENNWPFP